MVFRIVLTVFMAALVCSTSSFGNDDDYSLNGRTTTKYANGRIRSSINYVHGKKHGVFNLYDEEGTLLASITYVHDVAIDSSGNPLNGVQEVKYRNGKLQGKYSFKDGMLDGNVTVYSPDSTILESIEYKLGKKNGPFRLFHSNGRIYIEGGFVNNQLDGAYVSYFESGKVQVKKEFKEDKLIGKEQLFEENGSILSENLHIYLKNGDYLIEYCRYYDNERPEEKGRTINGNLDGKILRYHPNGKISQETEYKQGKLNGTAVAYFESGNLKAQHTFKDGELQGVAKIYFQDGQLKIEEHYKRNLRNGEYKEYSANGKLIKNEVYKQGILIQDLLK